MLGKWRADRHVANDGPFGSVEFGVRFFVLVNHAAHTVLGRASADLFGNLDLLSGLGLNFGLVQVKWRLSFLHGAQRSGGELIGLIS